MAALLSAVVTPPGVHVEVTQTFGHAVEMAQAAPVGGTVHAVYLVASFVSSPPVAGAAPYAGTAHLALQLAALVAISMAEAHDPVCIVEATTPAHVMPAAQVAACWQSSLGTVAVAVSPSVAAV